MSFLLAILIAVAAFSLMMTVLVASTRPLRTHEEPILGQRAARRARTFPAGPNWTEIGRVPPRTDAPDTARPPERQIAPSRAPETRGSRSAARLDATPAPAPRRPTRVNPNTWGRVRAELDTLKNVSHVRNAS